MTFIVNYINEIWWAQLGCVGSTPYRGVGKRMIMVLWVRLHRKFLLLQWLHNAFWNWKDNKSNIIDCSAVLECFSKHQSHLQWITRTTANAYDAGQTHHNEQIILLCLVLGRWAAQESWFIEFRFKRKRIQIVNTFKISHIIWLHRFQIPNPHIKYINSWHRDNW